MPVKKKVDFTFECTHCGKTEEVSTDMGDWNERESYALSFPIGWASLSGSMRFAKLNNRNKGGSNNFDKNVLDFSNSGDDPFVFCGLNCAGAYVITQIEKVQTCD